MMNYGAYLTQIHVVTEAGKTISEEGDQERLMEGGGHFHLSFES